MMQSLEAQRKATKELLVLYPAGSVQHRAAEDFLRQQEEQLERVRKWYGIKAEPE